MLTGTPLDLTPFGPLLGALGFGYWLLAIVVVGLALWLPKRWRIKLPFAVLVFGAFVYPVVRNMQTQSARHDQSKASLNASMALFNERCKSAGEKINRTVDGVEGVVWMRWRSRQINRGDQFKLDDPYGTDCREEGCILRLLRALHGVTEASGSVDGRATSYRFVETVDPRDGLRYRYTGELKVLSESTSEEYSRHVTSTGYGVESDDKFFALRREPVAEFTAHYGITWDDISTHEEREHWIAGGSLKVLDLATNEVVAEHIGYLIDRGQGSTEGFRDPWPWAKRYGPMCPSRSPALWDFATAAIRPIKQGE